MRVLVTGANGFIGKNLVAHLHEIPGISLSTFVHSDSAELLAEKVTEADFIFHLAGINRPQNESEYTTGNLGLTQLLCDSIKSSNRNIPVIYTSSIQASSDNPYGTSKRMAEEALLSLMRETGSPVFIYRLPNVFGKWSRPNYNSVVATFCYNISNDLPIQIHDPHSVLQLVYVDDVVADFLQVMQEAPVGGFREVLPTYTNTVGELAKEISRFKESRQSLILDNVGTGLARALYSTYISYFSPAQFSYPLVKHEDSRGVFVEMLKTGDSGQFSFFTAHPGVTRGGHYHHTKTEKFLVIRGEAKFRFLHIENGATHELTVSGERPEVVETVPGWSHDITNIGDVELIVMLWANEVFDPQRPDTISHKV